MILRGVKTVGLGSVKTAFRLDIEACTTCSTGGTLRVRRSEPVPATAHAARVVFLNRSLHQPTAAQTAHVVFVRQSLQELQHRRFRAYAPGDHTQSIFSQTSVRFRQTSMNILVSWCSTGVNKRCLERSHHQQPRCCR